MANQEQQGGGSRSFDQNPQQGGTLRSSGAGSPGDRQQQNRSGQQPQANRESERRNAPERMGQSTRSEGTRSDADLGGGTQKR